jgi:anti-sigma factor RsiW
MFEHVTEWLGPYLDGELHGSQLRQVEMHLEDCKHCRAELDSLRDLSQLLQEAPLPESFPSADRFAAQVGLQMPRQPVPANKRSLLEIGWWSIPFAILGLWIFSQVVGELSEWVWVADRVGLLGNMAVWISPARGFSVLAWVNRFGLLPSGGTWSLAEFGAAAGRQSLSELIWQAIIAIMYLSWLASWWVRHTRQVNTGRLENSSHS